MGWGEYMREVHSARDLTEEETLAWLKEKVEEELGGILLQD
jgi:hypothetical protein